MSSKNYPAFNLGPDNNFWSHDPDIRASLWSMGIMLVQHSLWRFDKSSPNAKRLNLTGLMPSCPDLDAPQLDLSNLDLSYAIMHRARLRGVQLRESDLSFVDLSFATLINADLRGADFYNANLEHADLRGANVKGARFDGANLYKADMSRLNFNEPPSCAPPRNLTYTGFADADWRGADLTDAKLPAGVHYRPVPVYGTRTPLCSSCYATVDKYGICPTCGRDSTIAIKECMPIRFPPRIVGYK